MTPATAGSAPPDKRRYVRDIFSDIAPRYDLLNHLLSMNVDRRWRRKAIARLDWETRAAGTFLDACAGTLDLAVSLAGRPGFRGHVVAADFAVPMLRHGAAKAAGSGVRTAAADTLALPFANGTFDGAIVGFGIRNLADVGAGFAELARVLKPGARLVILEFTTPAFAPFRAAFHFYFRRILPVIGRAISGHPTAYTYLPESVGRFPRPDELRHMMEQAGLKDCSYELFTGGMVAVHWGVT